MNSNEAQAHRERPPAPELVVAMRASAGFNNRVKTDWASFFDMESSDVQPSATRGETHARTRPVACRTVFSAIPGEAPSRGVEQLPASPSPGPHPLAVFRGSRESGRRMHHGPEKRQ